MVLPMRMPHVNLSINKTEMIEVILLFFKNRVVRPQQRFSMRFERTTIVSVHREKRQRSKEFALDNIANEKLGILATKKCTYRIQKLLYSILNQRIVQSYFVANLFVTNLLGKRYAQKNS